MTQTYAKIIGTGSFVPNEPITNDMLVERLAKNGIETSDQWIQERTGICQRYWANEGQTASSMGEIAARNAMEMAGISADEIDLVVVATSTGDMLFPSTACLLQSKIGAKKAAAFDRLFSDFFLLPDLSENNKSKISTFWTGRGG